MALYKDGNPVSGLNSIPRLTLAQYNALNVKPEFWVRTDAPESYKKLSADQVSYDSNNTVKDKIDNMDNSLANKLNILYKSYWTWNSATSFSMEITISADSNSIIVYGARNGCGFLAICPNNNNEVLTVYNNTGCTITNAYDTTTKKHTITLANPTSRVGSSVLVCALGW